MHKLQHLATVISSRRTPSHHELVKLQQKRRNNTQTILAPKAPSAPPAPDGTMTTRSRHLEYKDPARFHSRTPESSCHTGKLVSSSLSLSRLRRQAMQETYRQIVGPRPGLPI